jgi:hypothetical protein
MISLKNTSSSFAWACYLHWLYLQSEIDLNPEIPFKGCCQHMESVVLANYMQCITYGYEIKCTVLYTVLVILINYSRMRLDSCHFSPDAVIMQIACFVDHFNKLE